MNTKTTKRKTATAPKRDKKYVLCDGTMPSEYFLKNDGKMTVFDPEKNEERVLVKAVSYTTIWRDELPEKFERAEVKFITNEGFMIVKGSDESLQKFLDMHPDNEENGGIVFREHDELRLVQAKIDEADTRDSAIEQYRKLKNSDLDKLKAIAQAKGYYNKEEDIKVWLFRLREYAEGQPEKFLNDLNDPMMNTRSLVAEAISEGHLDTTVPAVVKWARPQGGGTVMNVPQGIPHEDALVEWLNTKDEAAVAVLDELKKLLGRK